MKKYFVLTGLFGTTFLLLASTTLAQGTAQDAATGFGTFAGLITSFTNTIVKATGTLLLSAAVVAFFFGVVQYIWGLRQGDATKAKTGNEFMIWGLVGLFVMFSVYGIIKFGQGILFNGKDITSITIPDINLKGSGGSPQSPSSPLNPGTGTICTPRYQCTPPGGAINTGTCNANGSACVPNAGGGAGSTGGGTTGGGSTGGATRECSPVGYECTPRGGAPGTGICNESYICVLPSTVGDVRPPGGPG